MKKTENEKRAMELSSLMDDLERSGIVIRKERQFSATMERGRALSRIHREKLYKGKYHSFKSCVEKEFGFTGQQARNLMAASETYDILRRTFSILPDNSKKLLQVYTVSKKSKTPVESVWMSMLEQSNE